VAHPFTRLVVTGLVLAAIGAEPAAAGTFHVYGLGMNGAGCPNGWQAQSVPPDRFRQGNFCSRWEIQSVRDGTALRQGDFAGTSMHTGAGARFTGFSIDSFGTARNGVIWQMAMCATPFANCQQHFPKQGTWSQSETRLGSLVSGGAPFHATHLWAGVTCTSSTCPDSASAGRAAQITHVESHAVVEDYTPPGAPDHHGVSTRWNSGQKELTYTASDAGSGVESVTLTVDGSLHRTVNHSCTRLPSGGYTQPVPCATATSGSFTLNEPGQLADGRHTLIVTARDAGGAAAANPQEFWVDNNAPGHPLDLSVEGGDGWRGENDFAVEWENPDQGNGSGIAGAYYKIGSAPETPTDGTRISEAGLTEISDLEVPGDGEWSLYVWLRDEAGNASHRQASPTPLRLDATAPSLAFADDRTAPAEVRVRTSDRHSGVSGGQVDIRRRGVAEWRALDTRREGTELVAAIPDDQLERGTYELRATAVDAVGNRATTTRREDGREMLLDLPVRSDTTLSASLSRRSAGAHRARRTLRIGYRRHAWLRGVLRSGGALLPDTRLTVHARRLNRSEWHPLTELITDGNGAYRVRLPRGVSREVRVDFAGSRSLRPASDSVTVRVRGWASLRLRPRRLHRGDTITFVGQVGHFRARLPAAGKLIQIQYLDGRRWRPAVKLGHTNRRGRFRIKYRFRRISRPTRIHFRILVPAEGGWPYGTGASRTRTALVRP
jgi:hypothetical protein